MTTATLARRKCRKCGQWSLVAFLASHCPKCKEPYGPWELGMDVEVVVERKARKP